MGRNCPPPKRGRIYAAGFPGCRNLADVLAETNDYKCDGEILWTTANQFRPEIVKLPQENLYDHGYWINKHWFSTYREENLAEFTFPEITDEKNRRYAELIANSLSVGIHI